LTILDKILDAKRREVEVRSREAPPRVLEPRAAAAPPVRSLSGALRCPAEPAPDRSGSGGPSSPGARIPVIAEVKKASPSRGVIRRDFDPVWIAKAYEGSGAAAISVLTDEPFFQGRLEYLEAIRSAVALPILRKDFIVDGYQVLEARAAGADALLLILAAVPDDGALGALAAEASRLGMEILWEVHDRDDLLRALRFRPRILGINNRNLKTFEVSLETTRALLPEIPPDVVVVSESGFFHREELLRMRGWGVDAFLIGESLMRADDPGAALARLVLPGGVSP